MSRKFGYLVVLALAAVLAFAGVAGAAEKPVYGGTFLNGSIGDAENLNPILESTDSANEIDSMIFNGVMTVDPKTLKPIPDLAESYSSSADQLTWTFKLRKDVKWQDGVPFTAEDVKFSYETYADPKVNSPRQTDFESIKEIKLLDKYTIQIVLKKPYSPFLYLPMGYFIVPKHILEGQDINNSAFNRKPLGTGPFKFKEWVSGDHVTVVRNDDYFKGKPYLDSIITKVVPNGPALLAQAEAGQLDRANVPAPEVDRMRDVAAKEHLKLYERLDFGYTYIGWNLKNPLFADKRVRQALTMAIDRGLILEKIYKGLGTIATSHIVPGVAWAYTDDVPQYPYDPAKAKKLLGDLGWKPGSDGILEKDGKKFSFTIMANEGNVMRKGVMLYVQQQLAKIGIDVKVQTIEWSTFIKQYVDKKKFDAIVLGWTGMGPDPDDYSLWNSEDADVDDTFNFVGYKNKEVDKLLQAARNTMEPDKRAEYYAKTQKIIAEELPYTFLVYTKQVDAFSEKVKGGIFPSPLGFIPFWEKVWKEK